MFMTLDDMIFSPSWGRKLRFEVHMISNWSAPKARYGSRLKGSKMISCLLRETE